MEKENIDTLVILQDIEPNGHDARRNSIPVIPQEVEPNDTDIRRNSISEIPQEMDPKGGGNSILVNPQELEPIGVDIRRSSIGEIDPPDIERNFNPGIPQEMEPNGGDVRGNSIAMILPEIEANGRPDTRRNSVPAIPQKMEPKDGDKRRNSILVIPLDPNGGNIRRRSIGNSIRIQSRYLRAPMGSCHDYCKGGRNASEENETTAMPKLDREIGGKGQNMETNMDREIQSRYLKAPMGSYHDYCKHGVRNASHEHETTAMPKLDREIGGERQSLETTISEERKKISTTRSKPSPDSKIQKVNNSVVTEKKVSSSFKEIDISMEDSINSNVKPDQLEPSSLPGSVLSLSNSKVISTISPKPSPDFKSQTLNNSVVMERKVISLTKKETVSSKKVPSPFKEVGLSIEASIDLKVKPEKLEPSLPASVLRLSNSKVISTISPKPSPNSETQKRNDSIVTEKRVLSSKKKETVSSEKVSSPFKEIDVSTEDSINLKVKPEDLEPSSLPGSVLSLNNSKGISAISPKPSPHSETQKLNNSVVVEKRVVSLKEKGIVTSKKVSSPFKEIDVYMDGSINSKVKPEQLEPSSLPGHGSSNQGKSGTIKIKGIPEDSSRGGNRKIRSINTRTSVLVEKKMLGPQTVSLSSKHKHSVKRVSNMNTGSFKNLKGLSHLKDQSNPRKVKRDQPNNEDMPEKILYVIESTTEKSTVEPTPNGVDAPKLSSSTSLFSEGKILKHARKGISKTRSPPSSEKKNLKCAFNGGRVQSPPICPGNKVLRHIQHSIRTSLSLSSSPSSLMSVSPSHSTHNKKNGSTSQHNTFKTENQKVKLKVGHKTRPQRSGIIGSDNKSSIGQKLTFRRGRVIELQPVNNTPRKLKFRQVRLLGEIQNSKGSIKRGSDGVKEVDYNQSSGAGIERGGAGKKEVDDSQSNGAGIKRGSTGKKEVEDSQSNGADIKRGSTRKKEGDVSQSNGADIKRGSTGKKEVNESQSNGAGIKSGSIGRKEVDDSQSNGAKIKSEKVALRNQGQIVEGSRQKSLRRKQVSDHVLNGSRATPEKVVLRHQDVKGKKDAQKLFNNVIEETASRLVETRKSKVKALVGAFETVISLQDTKPSVMADAC